MGRTRSADSTPMSVVAKPSDGAQWTVQYTGNGGSGSPRVVSRVRSRTLMVSLTCNEIAKEYHIQWVNPDPPHQNFRIPYHLRAGLDAWEELVAKLGALEADQYIL